jgi:putative DNA primase/helicase
MVSVLTDSPQVAQNGASEPEPSRERKPDSDDLAQDLEKHWKGIMAYFHSEWHKYREGFWDKRQLQEVHLAARYFLRGYKEKSGIKVSMSLAREVVSLAETELFMPDRKLMEFAELQKPYINLQNGLYNLETHELEPHRPDLYLTNQLPFAYDPHARISAFSDYLRTSLVSKDGQPNRDMAMLVGEAMAYSMTARTDLKASFWLVGQPNSGKSKLVSLIANIMGSLHKTIDLNQLATNRFLLSGIVGKRVVTFTEASEGSILPDAIYKTLVGGGDEIYADVKNKPAITFKPEAKFWWAMNNAPRTIDNSGAVINRLRVILFNRSIPEAEQIKDLDARLKTEMPGIFNWLMTCYRRLQSSGQFTLPTESAEWLQDFKARNDTYQTFVNERCIVSRTAKVSSRELYDAYRNWAIESGYTPRNINQVSVEWKRLGFEARSVDGYPYFYGLALKNFRTGI